jgi:hypothetical protein
VTPDRTAQPRIEHVALWTSDLERLRDSFSVGSRARVDELAAALGAVEGPRLTSDGYYEALVVDPDENRIELTV